MMTLTARRLVRLALRSALVVGGAAAGLVAGSSLQPGAAAAPVPSPEEAKMVAGTDPDDHARYLLQREIEDRAELARLLSRLLELRHQTAVDVVDDIR